MLDLPRLLYFKNKNTYSAGQAGMRWRAVPGKRRTAGEGDGSGQEEPILTVEIWPGPWTIDRTDPTLRMSQVFPLTEAGLADAAVWLKEVYQADPDLWASVPSILDCEPWSPPADPAPEGEAKG